MAVRRFVTLGLLLAALNGACAEQLMPTPEDAVPRDPSAASGPELMPPPQEPIQPEPSDNYDSSPPAPSSDD